MALSDTLSELARKSVATRNRVDILLDSLAGSDDGDTLTQVLGNPAITSATITRALRVEYGQSVVTDSSVDAWRRKNAAEVNGL